MADTQTATACITRDAPPRYQLTPAAVKQAMRRLQVDEIEDLAEKLGFSRQTFWRLRRGEHDIRLSDAYAVARKVGWPLDRTFCEVARG
ncbi:hypothetical protein ACIBCR_14720 [Micromonospora echinospora]|uniref:hypothetical protein n=1 Tax=Micromonospora echinospora TaxID=1877 RepID=UPI0037B9353B